jgi:nucleotide-binding universal stress UspA family protein
MTIASILLLLQGGDGDSAVAETAARVATTFDARIDGLIVRPDPREAVRLAVDGMSPAMIEGVMAATRSDSEVRVGRARAAFEHACAEHGLRLGGSSPTAHWAEETGNDADFIAYRGRLADLLVIGRPGQGSADETYAAIEAALFETGRPLLLAGPTPHRSLEGTAVIAWNGSTETTRAVSAALPFLARAEKVVALEIDPRPATGGAGRPRAEALCAHLACHDIDASAHTTQAEGRPIGEALLAEATGLGANLMVMGAYSHSRLRELVLGGITRRVLAGAEIPVLMAH